MAFWGEEEQYYWRIFALQNGAHVYLLRRSTSFFPLCGQKLPMTRSNFLLEFPNKKNCPKDSSFCLEEPNDLDARVLVIFQLRWSDIFDKSKVILKPSVSVILYLPLNCAKHNITWHKPNNTA